tara:strand:+ start:210 stop:461 length:252 start_codon:yes stop_codon:yes gene_type:complete
MKTDSTPKDNPTTHKSKMNEAPAELQGAPLDPFSLPPSRSSGALPTISSLKAQIVKTINNYSLEVKVDAAREMIRRLEKDYLK